MSKKFFWLGAIVSIAATSATADAVKLREGTIGCPTGAETSRIWQLAERDSNGKLSQEAMIERGLYMKEHHCKTIEEGSQVVIEWQNQQEMTQSYPAKAICVRQPDARDCLYVSFNHIKFGPAPTKPTSELTPQTRSAEPKPIAPNELAEPKRSRRELGRRSYERIEISPQ